MKRFSITVLAVFFIALFSVALFANDEGNQGDWHGKMMSHHRMAGGILSAKMILGMASELNLTSDQFDKLKAIVKNAPKKGENKDAMKDERDALKSEMDKDTPDETKIDDMLAKMDAKRLDKMKEHMHNMLAVRAILTKDQLDILKKMKEDKKAEMAKWKDKNKK